MESYWVLSTILVLTVRYMKTMSDRTLRPDLSALRPDLSTLRPVLSTLRPDLSTLRPDLSALRPDLICFRISTPESLELKC